MRNWFHSLQRCVHVQYIRKPLLCNAFHGSSFRNFEYRKMLLTIRSRSNVLILLKTIPPYITISPLHFSYTLFIYISNKWPPSSQHAAIPPPPPTTIIIQRPPTMRRTHFSLLHPPYLTWVSRLKGLHNDIPVVTVLYFENYHYYLLLQLLLLPTYLLSSYISCYTSCH